MSRRLTRSRHLTSSRTLVPSRWLVPLTALGTAVVLATTVPGASAASAAPVSETPELVVVLDSSGSMAETDAGGGQTRMDAAKQAVTDLATSTPDTTRIGLRTYGDGVDSQATGSCEDTTLRVPVGPVDRDAITQQVQALQPRGDTPIGTALLAAAEDFTGGGPQSVVLVSDGEPTCDPDPCPVAAQLAEQGIDLRIDVIGFLVDDEARTILECIADAGGGQYVDATDADQLTAALDTSANRGFRVYRPEGTPVEGALVPADAPTLTEGQHLDAIRAGEPRYYLLEPPRGWTVRAGVTITRGDDPERRGVGGRVVMRADTVGDDSTRCTSDLNGTDNRRGTAPMTGSVLVGPGAVTGRAGEECDLAGQYLLEVEWAGVSEESALPMEVVVQLEPPVVGTEGLGTAGDADIVFDAPPTLPDPEPVDGGGSFNDAPELGTGAWSDSMRTGEAVFYRVPVDWGQQLALRVDFDSPVNDPALEAAEGSFVNALLFDEARGAVAPNGDKSKRYFRYDGVPDYLHITTHPVTWANREEQAYNEVRLLSRPADMVLMLSMDRDGTSVDDEGIAIPYTISVDLLGEAEPGPRYEGAAAEEAPAETTVSTPAQAPTPAEPTAVASTEPSDLGAAPVSGDEGSGSLLPVLVGLAVLLLVALLGLVAYGVVSTRRRRAGPV